MSSFLVSFLRFENPFYFHHSLTLLISVCAREKLPPEKVKLSPKRKAAGKESTRLQFFKEEAL
jgi:hypothetical protein